jgi:phosphatidate cytidylyltransferase
MSKHFIIIFFISIIVSVVATFIQSRKAISAEKVKAIWTKYIVYIFVIGVVSVTFYSSHLFLQYFLLLALAIRSFYELFLIAPLLNNKWILIYPVVIITISSLLIYSTVYPNLLIYFFIFLFDGFSQIGGQLFGKIKITPNVSSGKTLAGLISGSIVASSTYYYLSTKALDSFTITKFCTIIIFLIAGCFYGDLGASYLKRKAGIKDFKTMLPEHGGVLDRFDSFYGCYFACSILALIQKLFI